MKKTGKLLCVFAMISLLICTGCAAKREKEQQAEPSVERTAQDIIEELAVYHGTYGEESLQKEEKLLKELCEKEPQQGEK